MLNAHAPPILLWDPPLLKYQQALESTEVCTKDVLQRLECDLSRTAPELLEQSNLPALGTEYLFSKLCHLYKTQNHLTAFPNNIL